MDMLKMLSCLLSQCTYSQSFSKIDIGAYRRSSQGEAPNLLTLVLRLRTIRRLDTEVIRISLTLLADRCHLSKFTRACFSRVFANARIQQESRSTDHICLKEGLSRCIQVYLLHWTLSLPAGHVIRIDLNRLGSPIGIIAVNTR